MTIDEKIEHYSWLISEESSDQVITVMMAKQIIHEALKKQREICAEVYRTNPEECWGCMNESILNASEPEI